MSLDCFAAELLERSNRIMVTPNSSGEFSRSVRPMVAMTDFNVRIGGMRNFALVREAGNITEVQVISHVLAWRVQKHAATSDDWIHKLTKLVQAAPQFVGVEVNDPVGIKFTSQSGHSCDPDCLVVIGSRLVEDFNFWITVGNFSGVVGRIVIGQQDAVNALF